MLTEILLGASALLGAGSLISNAVFGSRNDTRQEKQQSLQQEQLNQQLLSNYWSTMQNRESMNSDRNQLSIALDQTQEDIASNSYWLSQWQNEYDNTMKSSIDQAYSAYSDVSNALTAGIVQGAETGRIGGSVGLINQATASNLSSLTGNSGLGFSLNQKGSLGNYIRSTSLDMLADRQTAQSAVNVSKRSITGYEDAISSLNTSLADMDYTLSDMRKELKAKGKLQ